MKLNLKNPVAPAVASLAVGIGLTLTVIGLISGAAAFAIGVTYWIIATPVFLIAGMITRRKLINIEYVRTPGYASFFVGLPRKIAPAAPALTDSEIEHNATRHRK